MNSSTRRNNSGYDSMSPLHNSTLRPTSSRGRTGSNNTSRPTSGNQATVMNRDDMVCICFKAPPVMMNNMAANNKDCGCTCHMDMNNMDISGIDMMPETSGRNRSSRKRPMLAELEESVKDMTNDFEESILELEDDPGNVVTLGRFYRINSFR